MIQVIETMPWLRCASGNVFYVFQSDLCHMFSEMFCEIPLVRISFAAFVTLESFFTSVRLHVALQITRSGTSVIALAALVWLFSCVLPHHVIFQIFSCNAGKLAHCASVRLFPRVGAFVLLQIARLN